MDQPRVQGSKEAPQIKLPPFRLLLLCLLALLIPSPSQPHVVFEEIGEMAGALSYIHVTMELRLDTLLELVLQYRARLQELGKIAAQYSYRQKWKEADEYYDGNIKYLLDRSEERFSDVIAAHLWLTYEFEAQVKSLQRLLPDERRDKRSVLGFVVGTFMGLYNRKQLSTLKREISSLADQQVYHFSILRNHTALLSKIGNEIDLISKALQTVTLTNPAYVVSHLLKAEHKIRSSIEMATHTLQQLQHRRLSIDFLTFAQLNHVFLKVQ
jgi:hypothetical protein